MSDERYQPCKVIVFDKDTYVPFWLCKWHKEEIGTCMFSYGDKESYTAVEGLWDCKKGSLVPFAVIEKKNLDRTIPVGTKVAVTENDKVRIEIINSVEFNEYEDYYSKLKGMGSFMGGIEVPPGTKVIIIRHYKPTYIFESGRKCDYEYNVKTIIS